jgi:hypothetical protein
VEIAIILLVVLIGLIAGDLALVHALKRRRGRDELPDTKTRDASDEAE